MEKEIDILLKKMVEKSASDLHIKVGSPPGIRLNGELIPLDGEIPLQKSDVERILLPLLNEHKRKKLNKDLELDFAYSLPGVARFRVNYFYQQGGLGGVFRVIPYKIKTLDELGFPPALKELALKPRGLVLVTGPTGSGKSTTLAAIVDYINSNRRCHIVTIEDPVEFLHQDKMAFVNQREVGEDTKSFAEALKRALRQDPDVILIGEMRDLETISAAITAAETGHLVLGTLHTIGAASTVDRIIDVFPPYQQQQIRMQLSITLQGVISQVLIPRANGNGLVCATEIMIGNSAIRNLIREGKTHMMVNIIQSSSNVGMQTLDQSLAKLCREGIIKFEEALARAQDSENLKNLIGKVPFNNSAPSQAFDSRFRMQREA
jgi:twitching motility protein PilT